MRNSWYTVAIMLTACLLLVAALTLTWFEISEYGQEVRRPDMGGPARRSPERPQPDEGTETEPEAGAESTSGSPTEVLEQFVEAQRQGDTETMLKLYSGVRREEFTDQLGDSEQDLQEAVRTLRDRVPQNLQVDDEEGDEEQTTLQVSATIEGSRTSGTVTLVQENGWKVQEIVWESGAEE